MRNYISSIYTKLGTNNRLEVIEYAKKISLLSFQKTERQIKQSLRTAALVTAGLRIIGCIVYWIVCRTVGNPSTPSTTYQLALLMACLLILAIRFMDPSGRRVRFLLFLEFFAYR